MNVKSLKLIYFSPTKTTRKVLEGISQGIQVDTVEHLDLTPPATKTQAFGEIQDEFVIIGAPVYGGRVALEAVKRLQRIKANKTPAAVVVVYGNREYEDALLELKDLTQEAGFIPVAGGAFIGEHSYSNDTLPLAPGRPDAADLKKAKKFGTRIREKIKDIHFNGAIPALGVPGNFPYKERRTRPKISPITQEAICSLCGTCATVCPVGIITVNNAVITDPDGCIYCCSCIKNCPTQARILDEASHVIETAERLSKTCRDRKEPEIYF